MFYVIPRVTAKWKAIEDTQKINLRITQQKTIKSQRTQEKKMNTKEQKN